MGFRTIEDNYATAPDPAPKYRQEPMPLNDVVIVLYVRGKDHVYVSGDAFVALITNREKRITLTDHFGHQPPFEARINTVFIMVHPGGMVPFAVFRSWLMACREAPRPLAWTIPAHMEHKKRREQRAFEKVEWTIAGRYIGHVAIRAADFVALLRAEEKEAVKVSFYAS